MARSGRAPIEARVQQSRHFSDEIRGGLSWPAWAAPGIFACLLSLPCFGFTYLWDDYAFLNNLLKLRFTDLLPDSSATFYRPVSRGLYFVVLSAARESGPLLGHWINATALFLAVSLVAGAGARLHGTRTGILAGFLFAGLACVPVLVGWLSCAQDMLAIAFIMLAFHCQLSGRHWVALALTLAALLSKETALAAVPALVMVEGSLRPGRAQLIRPAIGYSLLVVAWALLHPGIRTLLSRGLRFGATGYVGLKSPMEGLEHAWAYVLEVVNLRVGSLAPTWKGYESILLIAAVLVALAWLAQTLGAPTRQRPGKPIVIAGVLLAVCPWLLTSAMVHFWSQYYAAFPALGSSLLLGMWLAGRRTAFVIPVLAVFFALGLWSRASELETRYLTENQFRASSEAHRAFEAALLKLQPEVPSGSQLLFSVQAHGKARVYHQVFAYQMPRFWYRDRTLTVRKPEDRLETDGPEFLFAVAPDLDVIRIDPASLTAVSSSGRQTHYLVVEQALRTYSMGLAGIGETDAAARLLVEMPEVDVNFEILHHRMAMMFLLADGREEDARRLAEGIPTTPSSWGMDNLPAVLAQQPRRRQFDAAGMRAFGVDTTNVDALRELARWFVVRGYYDVGGRFGDRILKFAPGSPLAVQAVALRDSVEAVRTLTGDDEFSDP